MPTIPSSVSTSSVTIGRVPLGFSAAPASGSSAGSATICERIPDIFIGHLGWDGRRRRTIAPLAPREKLVRNGQCFESRRQSSALSDYGGGRVARAAHRSCRSEFHRGGIYFSAPPRPHGRAGRE